MTSDDLFFPILTSHNILNVMVHEMEKRVSYTNIRTVYVQWYRDACDVNWSLSISIEKGANTTSKVLKDIFHECL